LFGERSIADTITRSGMQNKAGDGTAGVLDEFDLIPKHC
jgi:hypothetical protein